MPDPKKSPKARLTPCQREVMVWVSEGKSNWDAGRILGCAEATVKKHLQTIFRKLGVTNRVEAVICFKG